jgi:hypothetical protein
LPDGLTLDPVTGIISGTPLDGGTYDITVECVVSGGQTATKDFTITINNPLPTLTSLNPSSKRAETAEFILTLNGTNFVQSSVAYWNGSARATTYVSATELQATISANDIVLEGTAELFVVNPAPTGGTSNSLTFTIEPANQPPTVDAGGPYEVGEGGSVAVEAAGSDPDGDPLQYAWDLDNDGIYETSGQQVNFSAADLDGPTTHSIGVQVSDPRGLSAADTAIVEVKNVAPTAVLSNGSGKILEGGSATLLFTDAFDPGTADSDAGFLYSFDCNDDGVFEVVDSPEASYACLYTDNGSYTARGIIKDKDGEGNSYTATVPVANVAPAVDLIIATVEPVEVLVGINASADFSDPGVEDTHTAIWDWGDGTTSAGNVRETNGSGSVTGDHTYTIPGIYTITLTVTDKDNDSGISVFQYVVVYDPTGGFVTGGGWIDSPEGAYTPDPALSGKATFGFVSKYKKGANVPTGNTEFQFKAGDLNFHSDSYDWLVVAGAKAKFKGIGTINGSGNYGFMLSAIDAAETSSTDVDMFRIKIWDKDNGDAVVYDNNLGDGDDADPTTAIGKGNIIVHKSK